MKKRSQPPPSSEDEDDDDEEYLPSEEEEEEEDHESDSDFVPPLTLSLELEKELKEHRRRLARNRLPRLPRRAKKPASPDLPPQKKRRRLVEAPPRKIDTWTDLLTLAREAKALPADRMYRDCLKLPLLLEPLEEIDRLVGLQEIKQVLADHVVYTLQVGRSLSRPKMQHMVITGNSGVGKTTLLRAISKLFARMGTVKTERIVYAKRANLIGSYLGTTAPKTLAVINSALGGVLALDEGYALSTGGSSDADAYSRECLDTLNEALSEKGDQFVCILVGYREMIEKNIFALNEGLSRRFQWRFHIPDPDGAQLSAICHKLLKEDRLIVPADLGPPSWFQQRRAAFPQGGGSIQNLVDKIKICHAKRVFGTRHVEKGKITAEDFAAAFQIYEKFEKSPGQEDERRKLFSMYV